MATDDQHPDPMRWTRLEPITRTQALDAGLRASVHDPLWLLARQWQLGEFWGSDSGTPVQTVLQMECTPVTRFRAGDTADISGGATGRQLRTMEPLEMLVERERVRTDSTSRPDLAAEAGLHLLRLIDPDGSLGYRSVLAGRFPLSSAPAPSEPHHEGEVHRFLELVARRVPDGALLAWVVKVESGVALPTSLAESFRMRVTAGVPAWRDWLASIPAANRPAVNDGISAWMDWYDELFAEPGNGQVDDAWLPDRLEYAASVSVPTREGEVVLGMSEFYDGHLDWYSLDAMSQTSLGALRSDLDDWDWIDEDGKSITRTVIPSPVRYPGMPASRYWELEDARIDFGAITAGPQQLAHLLLVEFAIVYGDDWFIVPIDMPVGSLAQINWLTVTDTFGVQTLVPSAREVDARDRTGELAWDMFRIAADARNDTNATAVGPDALFLPPTLGASLHGDTVENVTLLRDEIANMAWAIERTVESPLGRPFDRAEGFHRSREEEPAGAAGIAQDNAVSWRYRLAVDPPDHWLPLFPTRIEQGAPPIHFLRGGEPLGRVLASSSASPRHPLYIHDEEVPREGAKVTRAYQYARWHDGRTYLWMARRKGVGRGEGRSGLTFDVLEPNR